MSARSQRGWCVPEVILVVASQSDEPALLLHAIRQAKGNNAKIFLVHAARPANFRSNSGPNLSVVHDGRTGHSTQAALERNMMQLLWKTVVCESIVLRDRAVEEIPSLVKSMDVDRVIVTSDGNDGSLRGMERSVAEELISTLEVPVCAIGRHVPANPHRERSTGRILLAVSFQEDCGEYLHFGCRFAEERNSSLTVLHVFSGRSASDESNQRTPVSVGSQLPLESLKEGGLHCPLEIVVREGDPAREILNFDARSNHDFILLGSAGRTRARLANGRGVFQKVMAEARCPLIILGPSVAVASDSVARMLDLKWA